MTNQAQLRAPLAVTDPPAAASLVAYPLNGVLWWGPEFTMMYNQRFADVGHIEKASHQANQFRPWRSTILKDLVFLERLHGWVRMQVQIIR